MGKIFQKNMMGTGKKILKTTSAVAGVLLLGVASWCLYSLLTDGSAFLLDKIGIHNEHLQKAIVIVVVFLIALILLGYSAKKVIDKITE